MENKIETADSPNGDIVVDSNESTTAQEQEAVKLKETNKQLFERAKKSETEAKELKEKLKSLANESKEEVKETAKSQSDEVDYKELAIKTFLKSEGVTHPDDQKIVQDEAKRLKLSLDEVVGMEHIKAKLEANKDARTSQAGLAKGKGRGSGTAQDDVDYWISKGELPADQELAAKVVNAKIKKEQSGKAFSDDLF